MSAMGMVAVIDGEETEFCLLGEWIEEETRYRLLKQMRFFKYFAHNKFLNIWRCQVRHATFVKAREKLRTELLRARSVFIKPLMEISSLAYDIDTTPFVVPLFKVCLQEEGPGPRGRLMSPPTPTNRRRS